MRKLLTFGIVGVVLVSAQACGATSSRALPGAPAVNPRAAALLEFSERIENYMDLRDDIVDEVMPAETTADPALIRGREDALAQRIRTRRANARHGDIFTPDVRVVFRRLLRPQLKSDDRSDILAKLDDDAPAPGAVPVEVNAKYPAGLPMAATPATLLAALPPLPRELEYRFIGKDMILLDQPADVILDYIRNAIE